MTRQELYNLIVNILPTYSAGQLKGPIKQDCCILRREMALNSMSSSVGYWDTYTVDVYSNKSPLQVDNYVEAIIAVLIESECEVQNLLSGDYWDEVLKAFSTSLSFRMPKTINYY